MTKKLYIREFTYRAYVLVDDEMDADSFDREIMNDAMEPDYEDAVLVKAGANPLNWPVEALVYHDGNGDIPLSQVLP